MRFIKELWPRILTTATMIGIVVYGAWLYRQAYHPPDFTPQDRGNYIIQSGEPYFKVEGEWVSDDGDVLGINR